MTRTTSPLLAVALLGSVLGVTSVPAAALLGPNDIVYAIDTDYGGPSTSPGAEGPGNVIDGLSNTKYLNFGRNWSGVIITPGASVVQSLRFTTANDAIDRDPSYFMLYGTTDPITSASHGRGRDENWTLIAGGALSLPTVRFDDSTVVDIANGSSYTSYKLLFPGVRNDAGANSMQLAEVQMYSSPAGGGSPVLSPGMPVVAVDDTGERFAESRYPAGEPPRNAVDGNPNTKYLNFGKENSGLIIQPEIGATIVTGFELWTANDAPERDPASYALYGRLGPVQYGNNSMGDFETWALISSGALDLPLDRFASSGEISFDNHSTYDAYKFVVTSLRDGGIANAMQFGDIQFYGVPEPSTIAMSVVGLAFAGWVVARRRKK